MPIDYSKWDNLDVSSSDDESENGDFKSVKPRVTRLDAPSKVTFGGPGGDISAAPKANIGTKKKPEKTPSPTRQGVTIGTAASATTTDTTSSSKQPSSWSEHGGLLETAAATKSSKRCLFWAQDRYSVTLRIELLGKEEKVASVLVKGILPYRDRHSATSTIKPELVVTCASGEILLKGDLPHPVHLTEEDEDDGGEIGTGDRSLDDWSVVTNKNEERFVVITLYKAVPMEGLTLWWRRPLTDFPEADLAAIRGSGSSLVPPSNSSGETSKDFLNAWEEAHKLFREGKGKRKPMKIS